MADTTPETGNAVADFALAARIWALEQWEVSLLLALFAFWLLWLRASYKEQDSRTGLINFLRHAQAANAYKSLVGWLLDRTDRWFLNAEQYVLDRMTRPAWSDRAMLLAILYPFFALILQWGATGEDGTIGHLMVIPAEPSDWKRGATIGGLVAYVFLVRWIFGAQSQAALQRTVARLGIGDRWSKPIAFAVALAVAVAVAAASTVAAGGAFAVAAAGAFASAVAVSFAVAVAGALAGAGAGAFAGAGAIAVAFVGLNVIVRGQEFPAAPRLLIWLLLMLGALCGGVWSIGTPDERGAVLIVLIAALPMINALFDFLSIGLTRWALRRGARSVTYWTVLYGLGDLIAAAVLFLMLGCAGIAYLHLLNSVAEVPLWPLASDTQTGGLFTEIRANPAEYWWLYATFLSTLLPTVIHFMIAVSSIGPIGLIGGLRRWMAKKLETSEQHFGWRWLVLGMLAAWTAFAITAPVVLIAWAGGWIAGHHPTWGGYLLDYFEGFYHLLPGA